MTRVCDSIMLWGGVGLIALTPLAFGTVHPRAYVTVETTIFLMVMLWMVRSWGYSERAEGSARGDLMTEAPAGGISLAVPLASFAALILFQLVPLPPSVLKILSPSTYGLYRIALPGWSGWHPLSIAPSLTESGFLKFAACASLFLIILYYPLAKPSAPPLSSSTAVAHRQRWVGNLRAGFPGGEAAAAMALTRTILTAAIATGLLVSLIAILQRFTWNGKILWFLIPYDWGVAQPGSLPRASGPFINPDHLGNYLSMVLPIAAAGMLFPAAFASRASAKAFQLFSGSVLFVLLLGILLSLSRGGWSGGLAGSVVLVWLVSGRDFSLGEGAREFGHATESVSSLRRTGGGADSYDVSKGRRLWLLLVAGALVSLVLALMFINSSDRTQLDIRLQDTAMRETTLAASTSIGERIRIWADSMEMVREFPLFGIGLGGWPDLFARYRRPPWPRAEFWREAHNDYVQALTETGIIGFVLFGWLFYEIGIRLYRGCREIDPHHLPMLAALIGGITATGLHEFFDFSLQIPSNAILFTAFLGLALRLARPVEGGHRGSPRRTSDAPLPRRGNPMWSTLPLRFAGMLAALLLIFFSLRQDMIPYPHNLKPPTSIAEAERQISSHPALPSAHLALIRLSAGSSQSPAVGSDEAAPNVIPSGAEDQREAIHVASHADASLTAELRAVMFLEPTNPYARDLYAGTLFLQHRDPEGLAELQRSAFLSPALSTHGYYTSGLIPWLDSGQKKAIEDGLKDAVAADYEGGVDALADFYKGVGRFADAANVYQTAARHERDIQLKTQYLLEAGRIYDRAGDSAEAEKLLREAVAASPIDPRPYQSLANVVVAAKKDLDSLKRLISAGIDEGADPFTMNLILAEAAQKAGDSKIAEAALVKAVTLQPGSFDGNRNLGVFYLNQGNFDRAADSLRRAIELNPTSADAFYYLGSAEEGRYQFAAAQKAYAKAAELAPTDRSIQSRYDAFRRRLSEDTPNNS